MIINGCFYSTNFALDVLINVLFLPNLSTGTQIERTSRTCAFAIEDASGAGKDAGEELKSRVGEAFFTEFQQYNQQNKGWANRQS